MWLHDIRYFYLFHILTSIFAFILPWSKICTQHTSHLCLSGDQQSTTAARGPAVPRATTPCLETNFFKLCFSNGIVNRRLGVEVKKKKFYCIILITTFYCFVWCEVWWTVYQRFVFVKIPAPRTPILHRALRCLRRTGADPTTAGERGPHLLRLPSLQSQLTKKMVTTWTDTLKDLDVSLDVWS